MLIFRYLAKDVFLTLLSLTFILLLIFLGDTFFSALRRVANGEIPPSFITNLMILELPNLLWKVLPLGFYISLLLVYSRLYAENEMTVLQACGYGQGRLLMHSLILAVPIALVVMVITLWLGPIIIIKEEQLLRASSIQLLIKTLAPGRFRDIQDGHQVFYVEAMNMDHTKAHRVFIAQHEDKKGDPEWSLAWVDNAFAEKNKEISEDHVMLGKGRVYQGTPGHNDYWVAEFERYQVRLPQPDGIGIMDDIRTVKTSNLLPLNNLDRRKAAELQWRLSIPLMVFILTLVVVPLSRVSSRAGRYAKLLPAILIFIFYLHFLCYIHSSIVRQDVPPWIEVWCLHITVAAVGLFLQYGTFRFKKSHY